MKFEVETERRCELHRTRTCCINMRVLVLSVLAIAISRSLDLLAVISLMAVRIPSGI